MAKKPKPAPAPEPKEKKKKNSKTPEPEQPAKPQRGLAIGDNFGWTGKLPATLLYEHCQKQKWNKVQFDMRKTGKGFIGIADLSWENPKTKEVIHVKMSPETDLLPPRETTNEARHFAATYTMFRLNYVKNLKMVLPTIFRDYWSDLESKRVQTLKKSKREHDRYYNANPFQVFLDERAETEARAKEKLVRENQEAKVKKPTASISIVGNTKLGEKKGAQNSAQKVSQRVAKPKIARQFPTIGRKAWENAPFVDFPLDIRAKIESSIKHHIKWVEDQNDAQTNESDPKRKEWRSQLVTIGFRPQHVDESLTYTHLFTDALEWLLFHVPEDDLPVFFTKTEEDSSVSLKISRNIQTEYLLQRLSLSGFDKDEIQSELVANGQDEIKTSVALTYKVIEYVPKSVEPIGDELEMWTMELEGIESVGTNKVEYADPTKKVATVSLNVAGITPGILLTKLFFAETYPHNLPGVQLVVNDVSFKLANYIKLSIIRQLLSFVVENNMLGDCFLYSLVEWLEQNVAKVIENPGPLSILGVSEKREVEILKTFETSRKGTSKSHKIGLLALELDEMRKEYENTQNSPQLKNLLGRRAKLPAWKKQQELVSVINSNKVTLVTGETGSGKSTQIVQFILDDMSRRNNFEGTIICTQPRRISTIGLAERISEERTLKLGSDVGYIIRGENRTLRRTRLLFVTTGVLLRMIQLFLLLEEDSLFANLEYIFIDEVHERSVDSDFLLIILKRIMGKFPKLRIVLMSATINTETFMNFFSTPVNHIHIEGRTFPIEDHYLDTILPDMDYTLTTYDGQTIKPKADLHFFKTGTLNYELIAQLCVFVDGKLTNEKNSGSILIFLPGIMEISKCIRAVEKEFSKHNLASLCIPLHSALSSRDQTRVFGNPGKGTRKIVVSTNIAETSITIPDCVVVVDAGRSKSVFFDSKANTTRLVENWCSRAEMAQRRGRSGRIQNGTCYHLYTRETESEVLAQPIPEIRRTRLENLYLVVKAMGISKVEEFLQSGLDAPELQSLKKARMMLGEIGALHVGENTESLSHLGKFLSFIPTDLQAGKMLLLGCIFSCVEICLTLAAVCLTGSPFLRNFDVKDQVALAKSALGKNQGDLLALAFAYHEWENTPRNERKKFIADNCLSYLTLQDIQSNRSQYLSTLKEIGFLPLKYNLQSKVNNNNTNYTIVRAIITGSFTPQLARVQLPDPKYTQTLGGAVEIDPDAKMTKFWIRSEKYIEQCTSAGEITELPATRAFVHPSSMLFTTNTLEAGGLDISDLTLEDGTIDMQKARERYDMTPLAATNSNTMHKSPFVVYTSSNHTTKLFLRELTPTSTLAALLFGGEILYDLGSIASGKKCPGIVLDLWQPIRTWCKNGVLLKRLRLLLDQVIENKLSSPDQEAAKSDDDEILQVVADLLSERR